MDQKQTSPNLEYARMRVTRALKRLETLFPPGAQLTFVMRNPTFGDDCYITVTSESNEGLDAVAATIRRHKERTNGR